MAPWTSAQDASPPFAIRSDTFPTMRSNYRIRMLSNGSQRCRFWPDGWIRPKSTAPRTEALPAWRADAPSGQIERTVWRDPARPDHDWQVLERQNVQLGPGREVVVALDVPTLSACLASAILVFPATLETRGFPVDGATGPATALVTGEVFDTTTGMLAVGSLRPQVVFLRPFAAAEALEVPLTLEQLTALDHRRGRDGLSFQVNLDVVQLGSERSIKGNAQIRSRIQEAEWLRALDQLGAAFVLTIQVPTPLVTGLVAEGPSVVRVVTSLREARSALRDSTPASAVAACRFVLEGLEELYPVQPDGPLRSKVPKERDQDERWSALHHALAGLVNAAHHDPERVQWSRADAEAVVAAVAGLVARCPTITKA